MNIFKIILVCVSALGLNVFAKDTRPYELTRKMASSSKCVAAIPGLGDVNFSESSADLDDYKGIEAYTSPDHVQFVLKSGHGVTLLEAKIGKVVVSTFLTSADQEKGNKSLRLTAGKSSVYCEI